MELVERNGRRSGGRAVTIAVTRLANWPSEPQPASCRTILGSEQSEEGASDRAPLHLASRGLVCHGPKLPSQLNVSTAQGPMRISAIVNAQIGPS